MVSMHFNCIRLKIYRFSLSFIVAYPGLHSSCSSFYHEIELGNSLFLSCNTTGDQQYTTDWLHNGTPLANGYRGVEITGGVGGHSRLHVASVTSSSGGTYTYRVSSDTVSNKKNFAVQILGESVVSPQIKHNSYDNCVVMMLSLVFIHTSIPLPLLQFLQLLLLL